MKSGGYDIYDSGTVISYGAESVLFDIAADLKVELFFVDDESKALEQRIDYNVNGGTLEMKLVNFNNSLGVGSAEPIEIGVLDNRKLFLNFRVYALLAKGNKTVHYTWYLGEEVKNG